MPSSSAPGDAMTFFVGSILFTAGGGLQSWLAFSERHSPGAGGAARWAATVQSAGTLFFNITTYQAMHTALTSPDTTTRLASRLARVHLLPRLRRDRLSHLRAQGWVPGREGAGWWQPGVNLLGCIFFGVAAVAGYVVPSTGTMLDQAAANWNTALGAACFQACALDTLHTDMHLEDAAWSAAP